MSWGSPFFVLAIIGMSMLAWVITTALRVRHGYPVENEWGGTVMPHDPEIKRVSDLLVQENEQLRGKLTRMEERIAVLERIATDKAGRLSAEIDTLR